ncbi:MAG: chaperonin GroEL [Rickettsiales bacterium]|jgi:chaperonin GroEL|nr:chaperonin GroEL [Rickettsiales bacterium]
MTKKIIEYGHDARAKMQKGISQLASAVATTLGPKGRNVVIEKSFGAPVITKDGVTVAKAIELGDPLEKMGAELVKSVAAKTAEDAGDGTTTATVLAAAIYNEGLKLVQAGMNPMEIKKGIDIATDAVITHIKKTAKKISGNEEIAQVATISANSDKELGDMIANAFSKVGNEGVIIVEEAKGMETSVDIVEGMQFDRGYLSPYFVTNAEKMECIYEGASVLIFDGKISNLQSMLPILEGVAQSGKSLLIIADDIDGDALATLVVNRIRGGLKIVAVKAPGFGDRKKETLKDIAILTGAEFISEELGMKLENASMESLGVAKRIIVSKENTTVIDGAGDKKMLESRVSEIRAAIEKCTSEYDKEKLSERLARLAGGVAVIRVGGNSELEVKEKKDRVDDAVAATRAAVAEGIVAGGGIMLLNASKGLETLRVDGDDQKAGVSIVRKALQAPIRQIAKNAGKDDGAIIGKLLESKDENFGYDASKNDDKDAYVDMIKSGIIDPAKVVRCAIQNAASVSGLLLTTEAMIADSPEKNNDEKLNSMGGMGGMGMM